MYTTASSLVLKPKLESFSKTSLIEIEVRMLSLASFSQGDSRAALAVGLWSGFLLRRLFSKSLHYLGSSFHYLPE